NAARRINRVVQQVERGDRNATSRRIQPAYDESPPVRLCKTNAAWNKGTLATLDVYENGTPPNETESTGVTLPDCVNKFANVASGKWVIVAMCQNGSHYLIAAECD
ncbi:hypothetical protein EBZ80_24535, partial [bacterium]|nr:hypothetical protein [bacterium]